MADNYLTVVHPSLNKIISTFSRITVSGTLWYNGTPCWIWNGPTSFGANRKNQPSKKYLEYGIVTWRRVPTYVHRFMYAWLVKPLPKRRISNLTLDHLCRQTLCANPVHLELIPSIDNTRRGTGPSARNARKTHCKNGHSLSGSNLGVLHKKSGRVERRCRTCFNAKRRYRRNNHQSF